MQMQIPEGLPPEQHPESTPTQEQSSENKQSDPWPKDGLTEITNSLNALANQTAADRIPNQKFQSRSIAVQWFLFAATFLAFGAAAYYAHIARLQKDTMVSQLTTMNNTFKEVQAQSKAVVDSAKAANDANRLTEESLRGRIAIKSIRLRSKLNAGEVVSVVVDTENIGHAAAIVKTRGQVEHWSTLPSGPMKLNKPLDTGELLEPGLPMTIQIFDRLPLTADFIKSIGVPGTPSAYFFGRFEYESLGKRHSAEFCAFIIRVDTNQIADSPAAKGYGVDQNFGLYRCPRWHDSD